MTHGLLLKYILSHGIGIDGFFTFFGGFLNQVHNRNEQLNFKAHQTCTGTKKTQVLNFKVHQTCTGTKKQEF